MIYGIISTTSGRSAVFYAKGDKKMKRKLLAFSLAAALLLSGCGKIDDDEPAANGGANAAAPSDSSGKVIYEPIGQNSKPDEETETTAETEPPLESVTETESSAETDTVPEQEPERKSGTVLSPDNISRYQFGFELYNDGHKDCWDKRYDCAKIMLEALAQPGMGEKTVTHVPDVYELNAKESKGFMTWLKFEEPMNFQVGDKTMSGRSMTIIDFADSYYFFVGEIEEIDGMMEFDGSYIPKIIAAATGQAPEDVQSTELGSPESYDDIDFGAANMTITSAGKEYSSLEGSENAITPEKKEDIIKHVLCAIPVELEEKPDGYVDSNVANDPSAFYMLFDFGKPTPVNVCGTVREIYMISLGGKPQEGFLLNVNNETVYAIDAGIVDTIKRILAA